MQVNKPLAQFLEAPYEDEEYLWSSPYEEIKK